MKRFAWTVVGVAVLAAGIAGCDWESGSDATSWSSSYNWVNFSGVYRGIGGGLLVTDYSSTPSIPGATNTFTKTESGGTLAATGTTKAGQVAHGNILPGSFMVTVGNIAQLADSGKNGILSGNGSGTVNYDGGTWSISLDTWSPLDQNISISYSYIVTTDGTTGGGAQSGATGKIFSFTLLHQGQHLTITDNNGAVYKGYVGEMRSSSGVENDDSKDLPTDGDTIIATFECLGTSGAGRNVKIIGTLTGTVAASVFTNRKMDGTWIEMPGKTGNVSGQTAAVTIVSSPPETGEETETSARAFVP